jgi:uncharacterized membrane protein
MKNKDNVLSNLLSSGKKENVGQAERVVSGVAGGALVAYGLKAGGLLGATLSLLGAACCIAARPDIARCMKRQALTQPEKDVSVPLNVKRTRQIVCTSKNQLRLINRRLSFIVSGAILKICRNL